MNLPYWGQVTTAIVGTFTVGGVFWRTVVYLNGLIENNKKTAAAMARLEEIVPLLEGIKAEFRPNGGSTTRDAITRIEETTFKALERMEHNHAVDARRNRLLWDTYNDGLHGYFETGPEGHYRFVSTTWLLMTDMQILDVLEGGGTGWINSVYVDDRERIQENWESCIKDRRTFDSRYRTRKKVWVISHATPVTTDMGVLISYVGTIKVEPVEKEEE